MNLLCLVFGHKSLQGIYSGAEYMRVVPGTIDGIGREHARLYATCPRCEREYSAGAIHLPAREVERQLVKKHGEGAKPNGVFAGRAGHLVDLTLASFEKAPRADGQKEGALS